VGADNEDIGVTDKLYLRPTGIVWGRAASEAVADGWALPLAGGPAACLAFECIERASDHVKRRHVPAVQMIASADGDVRAWLEAISATRAPICGLGFERPLIMGIVNVTPDSFSDGGDFGAEQSAIAQALKLASEGADIVDIGGESTRPGAAPVSEAEEMRRVLPVIGGLRDLARPISIDTRKVRVAEAAIQAGAALLNDVSALTHDARMAAFAARSEMPVVLMHAQGDPRTMQDKPTYDDVLLDVYDFLQDRIAAAEAAGISRNRIIADPGIGFGKNVQHNLALIEGISLFHGLGVPILLGASRKRFIGSIAGEAEPKRRVPGSIAIALSGLAQGVQLLRVHDVAETRQAADCWQASSFMPAP